MRRRLYNQLHAKPTSIDGAHERIKRSRLLFTEWTDQAENKHRVRTMKLEQIDKRTLRITDTRGNTYDLPKKAAVFKRA